MCQINISEVLGGPPNVFCIFFTKTQNLQIRRFTLGGGGGGGGGGWGGGGEGGRERERERELLNTASNIIFRIGAKCNVISRQIGTYVSCLLHS